MTSPRRSLLSCSSIALTVFSVFYFRSIKASQDFDRVFDLPGQPTSPTTSHFSGYITLSTENDMALFYWFFEAQTLPSKRPLLLWLNGGPRCSSVGYEAAVELGPLGVKRHGTGLEFYKYA
ncbi:serine carboxypeptidase-like 33 [Canna indica]|uniref:Serine carboxypeptidase-like 33 n=1 Tax=Canna indica TaxID=4628 RepID=A0AAQ3KLR9_9LILI|nr:serine carboxypeptidase-like 33 [Canna indica]